MCKRSVLHSRYLNLSDGDPDQSHAAIFGQSIQSSAIGHVAHLTRQRAGREGRRHVEASAAQTLKQITVLRVCVNVMQRN